MRLYSGMSEAFVLDTVRNQIATKLEAAFFDYFRYRPSPGEVGSWRNSLRAIAQIVDHAGLDDHGVLLEYQLPLSSKRLDFLICGLDENDQQRAVVVELKQWERCDSSQIDKLVCSWVGGKHRDVLHPSVQVDQYRQYLQDSHEAFHADDPIDLAACSYLHNYEFEPNDPLVAPKFASILHDAPLFAADATEELSDFLLDRLRNGKGRPVLDRIERSRFRPSRKLMEHVAQTIKGQSPWVLLDEQLVIYEKVLATVSSSLNRKKKQVIVVRGGPGTGKSVIAINLLAALLKRGNNAHYATGSRAFTETLWELLGTRSRPVFRYFNSYTDAEFDSLDVLVCDEAHRIRETSNSRFTPKDKRRSRPQIHELMAAAKVAVFLVDDKQVVRPNEIGSSDYIRKQAADLGAEINEYELEVQFRCAGSDGFVNWINNTLGIEKTANVLWDGAEGFDFQIFDSPLALESAIRAKSAQGHSARVAAGFCWAWSEPRTDGTLEDDVVIGDYKRPWDAKPGNWKLAPGIPSASLWATDPNGINQIGCVYNIQGFELDYIGVIWGPDLTYDFDAQQWVGNKKESADAVVKRSKEAFVDLVKNTYRVLLSRGLKGCYIHFMDRNTERFVRSRIETKQGGWTLKFISPKDDERYVGCVPVVPLKVAAGAFGESSPQETEEQRWVAVPTRRILRPGMFVAQVVGKSMEPQIADGSYCLFASPVRGSRNGKTVLVQLRDVADPETGERFTVKRYESAKVAQGEAWAHERVTLKPINTAYEPLQFTGNVEERLTVVAEFLEVLGPG